MKNIAALLYVFLIVAIVALLPNAVHAGAAHSPEDCPETTVFVEQFIPNNVLDVARADGGFTIFVAAVEAAGLEDLLTRRQAFTVFAPSDAAFAALPEGELDGLLANPGNLRQVILYHIVQDPFSYAELPNGTIRTALGKDITINQFSSITQVNNSAVVAVTTREADNGFVHPISEVLLPPDGLFTTRDLPPAVPMEPDASCEEAHKMTPSMQTTSLIRDLLAEAAAMTTQSYVRESVTLTAAEADLLVSIIETHGAYGHFADNLSFDTLFSYPSQLTHLIATDFTVTLR